MRDRPLWTYALPVAWLLTLHVAIVHTAIVAPPWSDSTNNPCATQPGGWQLLYWAPLKQCFKIFTVGYPCPETMELTPVGVSSAQKSLPTSVCRCPLGTAQSAKSSKCHRLFERGPCDLGHYFAPDPDTTDRSSIPKKRTGTCKKPINCFSGTVFWPKDAKCYTLHTKGPCPDGKLLALNKDMIAECMCDKSGELSQFYHTESSSCHEHFTQGPCERTGELFLTNGKCGCHDKLPHYHEDTEQCFEIGKIGPCPMGHVFILADSMDSKSSKATCQCKEGYALWKDNYCYRLYTRGPCDENEFLLNSTTCMANPCGKGRLYFPEEKTCYRLGSQGPCNWQQVVVFDFTTRPSVDGISYNGVCGCKGIITNLDQQCSVDMSVGRSACESSAGMVELNGKCFKLYSRGPCGPGQWLEPRKIVSRMDRRGVHCQCRPGYTKYESDGGVIGCYAPSVGIARYLNGNNLRTYTFGFRRFVSLMGETL